MKRFLTCFGLSFLLLLPASALLQSSSSAPATDSPVTGCQDEINARLASEERIYRTVLFGRRKAADEPVGTVRFDADLNEWLKTGKNEWRGFGPKKAGNDGDIDAKTERDPLDKDKSPARAGIFAQKKVLTSDLLPPLIQSYRAFGCRIEAVCEAARKSLTGTDPMKIETVGCRPFENVKPLASCNKNKNSDTFSESAVRTYCDAVAPELFAHEGELLKLSVSYDASYRSLLQFAGGFDAFLKDFQTTLFSPLSDSMSLLGQLQRIPCFAAQCNGLPVVTSAQ
jgi:hypothetical protein